MRILIAIIITVFILGCQYEPGRGLKVMGLDVGPGMTMNYKSNKDNLVKRHFNKYKTKRCEKAFALAYDYSGAWAVGFSHGKEDLKTAEERALKKCEDFREEYKVSGKCKIVALNNEIISNEELFE